MDKKSLLILGFAIVAIGLFIIPSTMSMFMGQHNWYTVTTASGQYKMCERCHFAEVGEWRANTGAHSAYKAVMEAEGADPGCFCHQINVTDLESFGIDRTEIDNFGYEFFNQSGDLDKSNKSSWESAWRSKETPHAAITIDCVSCHTNATAQLGNTNEAHTPFFEQSKDTELSDVASNNTACMACHTMIGLNITMDRIRGGLFINATHSEDYNWTVNVDINNTRTTESQYWAANETNSS